MTVVLTKHQQKVIAKDIMDLAMGNAKMTMKERAWELLKELETMNVSDMTSLTIDFKYELNEGVLKAIVGKAIVED